MSFLALIIALVLVNVFKVDIASLAQRFLGAYFSKMDGLNKHFSIAIAPLFLGTLLLQLLFLHRVMGILELILAVVVLCIAFKPFNEGAASLEDMLDEMLTARFTVIFWFVLFGPAFALLYVLLLHYEGAKRYVWIAEWLPARLLALTFALVGHFSSALKAFSEVGLDMTAQPREILYTCAEAVLAKDEVTAAELLKRALLAWLVIVAVITVL